MSNLLRNFRDDFDHTVRLNRDRVAMIDARHDNAYSYGDVLSILQRYGALFKNAGVLPGETITALIPNSIEMLGCFLATAYYGYGFAPLSPESTPPEINRWIKLARPSLVLCCDTLSQSTRDAAAGSLVETIIVDGSFDRLPADTESAPEAGSGSFLYLNTSGTTGEPKAMVIDSNVLWSSARAFTGVHRFLDENSRFLNILPMSYLGGLFNLGMIPLACGGSTVIHETFSGRSFFDFWQTIEQFDITVLWLVPTIIRGLLTLSHRTNRGETDGTKKVIACFVGTAPIDLQTKLDFEDTFNIPLLENFALSETTFFSSETLDTRHRRIEGSTGEVLPYAEVKLVALSAETDVGSPPHEIRLKSPFLFKGYLSVDGTIDLPLDNDGFFATGDLGHVDDKDRLLVQGRIRDIVKKGGFFVSLAAIERLAASHDDISEVAAVNVPHDFYGESFVLFVKVRKDAPDNWSSHTFTPWLHSNLVKHMWPERVVIVDEFPRTAAGKIRKHLLVEGSAQ